MGGENSLKREKTRKKKREQNSELTTSERDETRGAREGNKRSEKLRSKKRKNGKISTIEINEALVPQSKEVQDRMSDKYIAGNKQGEVILEKALEKKKRKGVKRVRNINESIEEEDVSEPQNDEEIAWATESEPRVVASSERRNEAETRSSRSGKSKKSAKRKKKSRSLENELVHDNVLEKREETAEDEVYQMSSGDEDYSKGMQKWITQYHQSRPGLKVLQERIDDFIMAHEAQEEQKRKEREAQAAEGGWTVVVQHKGRKKTTDAESGIAVGSVAQAAVLDKMAKKKNKDVGLDFYRFQKREAHRSEIMMLQSKFEQDKKRIQQMRAARKFRPY
ncbi:hypothetical protein ACJIZ3_001956 [Penstemon smallii]|uniref:Ribosomal RNA-processing protein 7 C-terminal domain-containing protein n=1 Tax=Penstemon smallii TaxID=265156 RepID=A0ABD3U7M8_9LAMI